MTSNLPTEQTCTRNCTGSTHCLSTEGGRRGTGGGDRLIVGKWILAPFQPHSVVSELRQRDTQNLCPEKERERERQRQRQRQRDRETKTDRQTETETERLVFHRFREWFIIWINVTQTGTHARTHTHTHTHIYTHTHIRSLVKIVQTSLFYLVKNGKTAQGTCFRVKIDSVITTIQLHLK